MISHRGIRSQRREWQRLNLVFTENRELRTEVEGRWWTREIHRKAEEHVSFEPVRYGKSRG